MSGIQRVALLIGVVVVLAGAFVALRPSNDAPDPAVVAPPPATATAIAATTPASTATTPKPKPPLLTAAKVTELDAKKGEIVRFRARSAADDEVHVHGYDKSEAAPAGKTIDMSFTATLEGIFEIEFETAGVEIAKLTVTP